MNLGHLFKEFRHDFPASIVVFFVAVPLCLGIALASGAPLFAGIIAGIVGGIVVGAASGSSLGVSGPAAGLAVIVLNAIGTLGSFEAFLLAVVLAGVLQIIMGYLRLGIIAHYFPTSVIKGMLAGIGITIILKQIPHALGYHADYEGDLGFVVGDENTISILIKSLSLITPGALAISIVSMVILLAWEMKFFKEAKAFKMIQGPLVAVFAGIVLNVLFNQGFFPLTLPQDQLVSIPVAKSFGDFLGQFTMPDFSYFMNPQIYFVALLIAVIASIETLLSVEAVDKMDPFKRVTPTSKELKAQGLGNLVSGLIGGLPVTQVIVRSSANVSFGGRTKLSAIIHGFLILLSAILIPHVLNMIPLATLACILFVVGYKLAKPQLFNSMYRLGWDQFLPFVVTIFGIVFTDLLKGITLGMVVSIFFILRRNYMNSYRIVKEEDGGTLKYHMKLTEEVSFLNKGAILKALNDLPEGSQVIVDGRRSVIVDHDVIEVIKDFMVNSKTKNIQMKVEGLPKVLENGNPQSH